MSYIEIFEDTFNQEVLNVNETPVLVDFWAPWCQPCLMLAPVIDEISDELDGEVKVCKYNCDEGAQVAADMGVMSIPCLVLFEKGEEKGRLVGLVSKEEILDFIRE